MPDFLRVDVAVDTSQRLEFAQFFGDFHVPEIAGVPDFIAVGEDFKDIRIEKTVGVRDNSNFQNDFQSAQQARRPSHVCENFLKVYTAGPVW